MPGGIDRHGGGAAELTGLPGLTGALDRYVRDFEARIEKAVRELALSLPPAARVLDAGAGESRHRACFARQRYVGVDLGVGDATWNYRDLDVCADLAKLPFADETFDAALNIVTLEHVLEPAGVLREIRRVLKPGGRLLMVVPLEWEEHQQPHDYFRYTQFGVRHLLSSAGLEIVSLTAAGGIFRLLSRRCFMALKTAWWMAPLLIPLGLLFPLFDGLDRRRHSTLGYVCIAKRPKS